VNPLFPPEIRTASLVRRWSIVRTLNPDPVSGHSFYVTFYARQIAQLIHWPGPMAELLLYALLHDIEETITGDILGPVKAEIVDEGRFDSFIEVKMSRHLPGIAHELQVIRNSLWGNSIQAIVKVADKVDAVLYLMTEVAMGNARLQPLLDDAMHNLDRAWMDMSSPVFSNVSARHLWNNDILPAIEAHKRYGGVGLV